MRGAPLGSTPHFRNIVIMAVYGAILFGLATLSQGGAQAAASSIPVTVVQPNVGQQDKRSEEHTSELQSLMRSSYAVFCLKKKKKTMQTHHIQKHYNE